MAKPLQLNATTGNLEEFQPVTSSAGAGDATKLAQLDSNGKWDITLMPSGVGSDTQSIVASEALSAGDFVNIYNNAGSRNCRKANATDATKPAHGFVLASVSQSASATVYTRGYNSTIPVGTFVAADVGKPVFLSPTTAGGCTITRPTATAQAVQRVGVMVAVGGTVTVDFSQDIAVVLV